MRDVLPTVHFDSRSATFPTTSSVAQHPYAKSFRVSFPDGSERWDAEINEIISSRSQHDGDINRVILKCYALKIRRALSRGGGDFFLISRLVWLA